jgi:hypothetical protein
MLLVLALVVMRTENCDALNSLGYLPYNSDKQGEQRNM